MLWFVTLMKLLTIPKDFLKNHKTLIRQNTFKRVKHNNCLCKTEVSTLYIKAISQINSNLSWDEGKLKGWYLRLRYFTNHVLLGLNKFINIRIFKNMERKIIRWDKFLPEISGVFFKRSEKIACIERITNGKLQPNVFQLSIFNFSNILPRLF